MYYARTPRKCHIRLITAMHHLVTTQRTKALALYLHQAGAGLVLYLAADRSDAAAARSPPSAAAPTCVSLVFVKPGSWQAVVVGGLWLVICGRGGDLVVIAIPRHTHLIRRHRRPAI